MIRSLADRRPVGAMAVVVVAVVVALGGTATAATLVTSSHIKNNTIRSADVRDRSLRLSDLATGVQRKLVTKATNAGPTGPAGPAGPAGPQGIPGLSQVEVVSAQSDASNAGKFVEVQCPQGKTMIAPGASISPTSSATLTAVRPEDGGAQAVATDDPDDGFPWRVTAYAVCAAVG